VRPELRQLGVALGELGLDALQLVLHFGGGLAQLGERRVVGLARSRHLLHLGRHLVLLGADLVAARRQSPPALVQGQQLVERVRGASPRQRLAGGRGVAADVLQVEQGSALAREDGYG
jgi:hypothetical protein